MKNIIIDIYKNYLKGNPLLILLVFLSLFFPFILGTFEPIREKTSLDYLALPNIKGDTDYFLYYKAIFLVLIVSIGSIIALSKGPVKKTKYATAIFLFFGLIIASSFLSNYRAITIKGVPSSYQGMFVWFSYGALSMLVYSLKNIKSYKVIIVSLLISATLVSIYGMLELFGIIDKIEVSKEYPFLHRGFLTSLFYTPGFYVAYLSIFSITAASCYLFLKSKKIKNICLISFCLLLVNLAGTKNKIGFWTFVICLAILIFILLPKIKVFKKQISHLILSTLVIGIGINIYVNSINKLDYNKLNDLTNNTNLKDIVSRKNVLEIQSFNNPSLFIRVSETSNINFYDNINLRKPLPIKKNGDVYSFDKKSLSPYKFKFNSKEGLFLIYENLEPIGIIPQNNNKFFIKVPELGAVAVSKFEKSNYFNKRNTMLEGRGLIWALSLPLLSKTFFLGYGADSFSLAYPNEDILSKFKTNLVDFYTSAHSLYIQMGVEFGVLALIIFVLFIIFYIKETFKSLITLKFDELSHFILLSSFLGVISFLIISFFISSSVSFAPYFWILIGISLGCNDFIIKKEIENK